MKYTKYNTTNIIIVSNTHIRKHTSSSPAPSNFTPAPPSPARPTLPRLQFQFHIILTQAWQSRVGPEGTGPTFGAANAVLYPGSFVFLRLHTGWVDGGMYFSYINILTRPSHFSCLRSQRFYLLFPQEARRDPYPSLLRPTTPLEKPLVWPSWWGYTVFWGLEGRVELSSSDYTEIIHIGILRRLIIFTGLLGSINRPPQ